MASRSPRDSLPRLPTWALAVLVIAAAVAYFLTQRSEPTPVGDAQVERLPPAPSPPIASAPGPRAPTPTPQATPTRTTRPVEAPALDLEGIGDADERTAIAEVAGAIDRGGPFAYRKDGTVFENRERRLAARPRGHWREYTVPTPGEDDRGARRLVAGQDGELFYTRDHYRTFRRVRPPR